MQGRNPENKHPVDILALETLAWWDWPIKKIAQHLELIVSGDIEALRRSATDV